LRARITLLSHLLRMNLLNEKVRTFLFFYPYSGDLSHSNWILT